VGSAVSVGTAVGVAALPTPSLVGGEFAIPMITNTTTAAGMMNFHCLHHGRFLVRGGASVVIAYPPQ
jgi:hypothetical protein